MRESILKRLKGIFDEMDFLGSECAIDSLIRIEDDNFDRCTSISECYYGMCEFAWVKVCNSLMGEDLREVR